MKKYEKIEADCLRNKEISQYLIDEYLIYYCAERENLEPLFDKKTKRFRHIIDKMPQGWYNWLLSQFVAFQLFKKGGYAQKYLFDPSIRSLSDEDYNLIKKYVQQPWKFSFCFVKDSPAPKFFNMIDPLTNESFLLYSPSIENISKSHPVTLYFLLLQFNGSCWETYGTVVDFQGITISDILFYARQLDPAISDIVEIPELIEKNPIPFSMLHAGARLPLVFHDDSLIIMNRMEFLLDSFIPEEHAEEFSIERNKNLYKMSMNGLEGFPHFVVAYYNQSKQSMMLTSMTDDGLSELTDYFESIGYELPYETLESVTPNMLNLIEEILGWDITFFPDEKYFVRSQNKPNGSDEKKIKKFIDKLIQDVNAGREPDVASYAVQCGLDEETAREIASGLLNRFNKLFH